MSHAMPYLFAKAIAHAALFKAQDGRCHICGALLPASPLSEKWSFDHVWPSSKLSRKHKWLGNVMIAHRPCNARKSNRQPTGCEIILLDMVNRRLGLPVGVTEHFEAQGIAA